MNGDQQWFPKWFWWPFYVLGAPVYLFRWLKRKVGVTKTNGNEGSR